MPFSINFAYHLTKERSKEQKKDQALFKKAVIVGIVAVVIVVVSVIVRVGFDVSLSQLEKEEKKIMAQLETLKAQELAYVGYVSKVNVLSELFQNRQAKQQALKKFRSLFGPGVSITGLNYSEDSNDLEFQLKTGTVFLLDKVVGQLDAPDLRSEYKEIAKKSVSRQDNGNYGMTVSVGLQVISPTPDPNPVAPESVVPELTESLE